MSASLNGFERLKHQKTIDGIFQNGKHLKLHPFKVVWSSVDSRYTNTTQFGISVPKRNFKLAVSRNKIKRRCREAFRKNKQPLVECARASGNTFAMMFIYIAKDELDYSTIELKIKELLSRLMQYDQKGRS